ncbi:MAG: DUF1146 domain-containing protein [Bacilli bacterium]|nr:DUF1146 domain-containing protein [Bacilli bacterium]
MLLKAILYIIFTFLAIWALDSININGLFKQNRYYASRVLYLMVSISLSYLVTNFLYDFFTYSNLFN